MLHGENKANNTNPKMMLTKCLRLHSVTAIALSVGLCALSVFSTVICSADLKRDKHRQGIRTERQGKITHGLKAVFCRAPSMCFKWGAALLS